MIHSSLRTSGGNKHRSVLKRYERLKVLHDKELWSDEKSVLGIPKVKMQRLKVKKEKAATVVTTPGAAAPAGTAKGGSAPARPASASGGKAESTPAKPEKK